VTEESYGIKVSTILHIVDKLTADLEYLCSLVEQPDAEFVVCNAVIYSHAVADLANQLDFVVEDLSQNELSEDEMYVKLSKEEIMMLNRYTETSEEALERLEEICGISLRNN
jgi:hypothetical protein